MSRIDWPELKDYFRFYGLDPVYHIDIKELKNLFLGKSRQFHPDFFGENPQDQLKAIEVTAYNNKAFKVLNNPMERARYLIRLNDTEEGPEGSLPQAFLMEMMDLNEQIDEFEFAADKAGMKSRIEDGINADLLKLSERMVQMIDSKQWNAAKEELLKVNYLERLKNRLAQQEG